MNDRETRRYDMFGRVQTFGKDNTADFAAGSKAAGHFSAVTQVIKDLDTEKAKQGGGTATAKEVLLDALRLDEDLSFRGLLEGNHGQRTKHDESCVVREEPPKPSL